MDHKAYLNKYLSNVVNTLTGVLDDNLLGVYQIGSISLNDYLVHTSDIDLLVVVNESIPEFEKHILAKLLSYENLRCPAAGLDIIILKKKEVEILSFSIAYEFWFSTGATWPKTQWECGVSEEVLIFIELCRRHGLCLIGLESNTYFAKVPLSWLYKSFDNLLSWHVSIILDPYHDPNGVNSILNACRVLAFIYEDEFYSKSLGGAWYLRTFQAGRLVKSALDYRIKKRAMDLDKEEINRFLNNTRAIVKSRAIKK